MSFVLHKGVRNFFDYRDQKIFFGTSRDQNRIRDFMLFDAFYACLLVGTCISGVGQESDLEATTFIAGGYPDAFRESKEFIAGLVVKAELVRLNTESYSSRDFEREISKLLDVNSPTRLSEDLGINRANCYAAGGFDFIEEKLRPKPVNTADFLLRFHDMWEQQALV